MIKLLAHLQVWRLRLSHNKMLTAIFDLNNREGTRELKAYNSDDVSHSIQSHLSWCKTEQIAHVPPPSSGIQKKLSLHVILLILLRRLVGLEWGAGAKTSCTANSCLTDEYCKPVWCRSAYICLVNSVLNQAGQTYGPQSFLVLPGKPLKEIFN